MQGVAKYIPQRAYQGYTLFCPTGREAPSEGQPGHAIYLFGKDKTRYRNLPHTKAQSH